MGVDTHLGSTENMLFSVRRLTVVPRLLLLPVKATPPQTDSDRMRNGNFFFFFFFFLVFFDDLTLQTCLRLANRAAFWSSLGFRISGHHWYTTARCRFGFGGEKYSIHYICTFHTNSISAICVIRFRFPKEEEEEGMLVAFQLGLNVRVIPLGV